MSGSPYKRVNSDSTSSHFLRPLNPPTASPTQRGPIEPENNAPIILDQMLGSKAASYLSQSPESPPPSPFISRSNETLIKEIFEFANDPPNCYYWLMNSSRFWIQLVLPQFKDVYTIKLNHPPPIYDIFNERGNRVFGAIDMLRLNRRTSSKSFSFKVVDSAGTSFFSVTKKSKWFRDIFVHYFPYWCFGPYKHEAVIATNDETFQCVVKQQFRMCRCNSTSFIVMDEKSGHELLYIDGPGDICALGMPHGVTSPETPKFIFKDRSDFTLAILRKTYAYEKYDTFYHNCPLTLVFSEKAELRTRLIALGCAFLFDFMFFHHQHD